MASSSSQAPISKPENKSELYPTWHLPLYKAALRGDWESSCEILKQNPGAATAKILGFQIPICAPCGCRDRKGK
ncbi:hypothetical protein QQP08_026346 [Theobroma cacao]|nr:hypothetical protein QQP08_026346 [Theobroma cacao]